jgi:hypothetical protein
MPSIINASSTGSGGIVQTADASGVLQLQSNGTVALTVSGSTVTLAGATTLSNTLQVATTIGVGGATPAASGAGITFPATQSASSNANTLDDYEEGSWTPTIQNATSYSSQVGQYTKIGRQVTVTANLLCAFNNTGATGITLTGLPFASSSVSTIYAIGRGFQVVGWNQSNQNLQLQLGPSATSISLYTTSSSTSINYSSVLANSFGTSVEIEYTMTYFTE